MTEAQPEESTSDDEPPREDASSKANMRRAQTQHDERWHQAELDVEFDRQVAMLAEQLQTARTSSPG